MPSAGLQIFGSGLRLQQVTPGVQDVGNARISGAMIANQFTTAQAGTGPGSSDEFFGHDINKTKGMSDSVLVGNALSTSGGLAGPYVIFGKNCKATGQSNVSLGIGCNAGTTPANGFAHNVAVGSNVNAGSKTGDGGYRVAYGAFAVANGAMNVAIGRNVNITNTNNNDSDCFGFGAEINIGVLSKAAFLVGHGIQASPYDLNNVLVVGVYIPTTNNYPNSGPGVIDNSILIGNEKQRSVKIGPYLYQNGMSVPAFTQTATGSATNTAAETTISAAGTGSLTIAANRLAVGSRIKVEGFGVVGDAAGIQTLRIRIKTAGGVVLLDTGAATIPPSLAGCCFVLEASITARTIGAGGTVKCNGRIVIVDAATAAVYGWSGNIAGTVALDTTAAQTLSVTAQWGAADPANALDLEQLNVEVA